MMNIVEVGTKVVGNWGAGLAYSFGEITEITGNEITILWVHENDELVLGKTNFDNLKTGEIKEIGVYLYNHKVNLEDYK